MLDASTYSFSRSRGPAVVKGTAIMDEVCVCCAHRFVPSRFPSSSGRGDCQLVCWGWTWIQTPACCCCWLCQRHNGAQRCIIPSFSLLTHSLTSANINAPFCVLFLLSGVAKVIRADCLLGSPQCWVWGNVLYHSGGWERGSYWSCHQYSNYSLAPIHFRGKLLLSPLLVGFSPCHRAEQRKQLIKKL